MVKYKILFLFFICGLSTFADNRLKHWLNQFHPPTDSLVLTFDTNYINPLLDGVTIRYYSSVKTNDLIFRGPGNHLDWYRANSLVKYGLGFGYRWLIVNWAFFSPHEQYQIDNRGKTKAFDIQMNMYGYRLLFDFRYSNYSGYYLENTNDRIPNWTNRNLELQRPDISNFSVGGNLRYQFNRSRYSFKAAYDQTQQQIKSAGTLFGGICYSFNSISTHDNPNIVLKNQVLNLNHLDVMIFGVGGGFAKTFVWRKKWFFALSGELYVKSSIILDEEKNNFSDIFTAPTTLIRSALGYNSARNYFGITGVLDYQPYIQNDNIHLYHSISNFRLIYARRFNIEKFNKRFNILK
jgi:hypothetical protein